MHVVRRTKNRLWRWRNNPLRRPEDVLEAWVVLAVWVLIAVGGTLAGVLTAHAADDVFAQQRAERSAVRAVLLTDIPQGAEASAGSSGGRTTAKVRWTTPDGSTRTGTTLVDAAQQAGSTVKVWTNRQGDLTTEPPSQAVANIDAALLGTAAALALSGLAVGVGRVVRRRLDRRRIDRWGTQWDLIGPLWGHRTG
ncbi:hypothetical protein F7R91_38295 [Streptomyces luteolifulvus]|uniref:Uncharacterized protein n=1 Tax=Streptomyces luteolifulvus TaxID=2615112 RepID=A0A6H9UP35_9ACTN|nr:hypothetical protein [Streptomyces luteolifulvus]KAB1139865.1 hypothetical protein F7R91_38295 [Streptomyces luteolifulvus]